MNNNFYAIRKVVPLMLLAMPRTAAYGQKWQLKRDEDGIKIYTATTENSAFKSIRVTCAIDATPQQLIGFLLDLGRLPEWAYNTKSVRLLKKIRPQEMVFLAEVNVPWPCTNRDYIAHFTINQPYPGLVTIDSRSEPDMVPPTKGIVRVRFSLAHWDITTINDHQLNVVYTVQFDPAGTVPAWLTNLFLTKGPFSTFEKVRDKVKDPAYRNAHYDFIK